MSPKMMRQFWSLLHTVQASVPLSLDDRSLVQWLIRQLNADRPIDSGEAAILNDYICARLPLIRDLAQEHRPS